MLVNHLTSDPLPDGGRVTRQYTVARPDRANAPGGFIVVQTDRHFSSRNIEVDHDVHSVRFGLETAKLIHEQLGSFIQQKEESNSSSHLRRGGT